MEIRVDKDACLLWLDGEEVKLTRGPWEVFLWLWEHQERYTEAIGIAAHTGQHGADIKHYIWRLRKLGLNIETRIGFGYRLIDGTS